MADAQHVSERDAQDFLAEVLDFTPSHTTKFMPFRAKLLDFILPTVLLFTPAGPAHNSAR